MTDTISLEQLCGTHILSGYGLVGMYVPGGYGRRPEYVNQFYFTLDGITYIAEEDPEDGYRSSLRYIKISDVLPKNYHSIIPITVNCMLGEEDDDKEVLYMIDRISDLSVVRVGTIDVDDYYPCFVSAVYPDNMWYNNIDKTDNIPSYVEETEQSIALRRKNEDEFWKKIELFS